jgi:two-component system chemotaxis response regulator CheB
MSPPIRVLVVDDSSLIREMLVKSLTIPGSVEVVGTASDGLKALAAVERLAPDVVTLDVEMPGLTGLEVLARIRDKALPVIVVASMREAASDLAVQALTAGAFDFYPKPSGPESFAKLQEELGEKIKAASRFRRRALDRAAPATSALASRARPAADVVPPGIGRIATPPRQRAVQPLGAAARAPAKGFARSLIAIGASTGGPQALSEVLRSFPANVPPVLIVQHMPEGFTKKFAERLDGKLAVRVQEASDGQRLKMGTVLLAPGTKQHMVLAREGHELVVRLVESAPVMHHRPSVDILFRSCAEILGRRTVAALLTGMGSDGARGLLEIHKTGATTIAQDEASCVVYGMPMEAIALGAADYVLPIGSIGPSLVKVAQGGVL